MDAINSRLIEQWANDLARTLWPLWQWRPALRQFNLRDEVPLADLLVPAIAAGGQTCEATVVDMMIRLSLIHISGARPTRRRSNRRPRPGSAGRYGRWSWPSVRVGR